MCRLILIPVWGGRSWLQGALPCIGDNVVMSWRIDEGLRMVGHPDVIFKDGPSGRRAALADGPGVWELIKYLREIDDGGPAALEADAEAFAGDPGRIVGAVSYYGDYPAEIDAEIDAADQASLHAEQAWRVRQQLIA